LFVDRQNVRTNRLPMTSGRLKTKVNQKNQKSNGIGASTLSQAMTQDVSQPYSQNMSQVLVNDKGIKLQCYE
jgi:regulator of nonsense transcripts 1